MKRLGVLAVFLTLVLGAGCVLPRPADPEVFDPRFFLGPEPSFEDMPDFRALAEALPGTPAYERARIHYLLERMRVSPLIFIRNGREHSGRVAAMHFRMKYHRWAGDSAHQAEDFVREAGSRSSSSGRDYLVRDGDGRRFLLEMVLRNELRLLESGQRHYVMKKEMQAGGKSV